MADLIRILKFLHDFTTEESALYACVVQGASPNSNRNKHNNNRNLFQSLQIHKAVNVSPKYLMGLHLLHLYWSNERSGAYEKENILEKLIWGVNEEEKQHCASNHSCKPVLFQHDTSN